VAVATALAIGAMAVWLGVRAVGPRSAASPAAATSPSSPAPAVSTAGLDQAPAVTAAPATPGSTPPQQQAGVDSGASGGGTTERFDIVVASFRTDARATSVSDQVTALGLSVRRRSAGGWQQLIAGPFASRGAAEEAQQRLGRAGLAGTQIVPAAR
jgi:cell division protein FtsN